ncbi:response regulator [Hoeflea sp. AS60]|uniref:response regulator n=1 Tax=Hoeflea sp. AS60 TaxID=3135780 RepID=UPI00317B1026
MKKTVLLIEDDPLILMDVEATLIDEGFEIITAESGTLAIETFDAEASRIDAIVTDIRLGSGPNGWDIGHHVREAVPNMPLVYMSGDSSQEWEAQGVPNSIMVPKPFVHAQIITALATLMNNPDQN